MNSKLNHVQNWPELARQASWSATALAKLCGVSVNTLRRHFLQQMRKTPGTWLAEQRQHQAIELLRDGSSIKETASCLGYKQQTNFTRKFKEFWGACPSLQSPVHLIKTKNERK
jgi:AraC-like DNA-binding protein